MAAPNGPIPMPATRTISRAILTEFATTSTTMGVLVSKYPRKTPVDADMQNIAGAANARVTKKSVAYPFAIGPVMPVPISARRGCCNTKSPMATTAPKANAKVNACPPSSKASLSLPDARRDATKGVVAVHRKLNTKNVDVNNAAADPIPANASAVSEYRPTNTVSANVINGSINNAPKAGIANPKIFSPVVSPNDDVDDDVDDFFSLRLLS
mmetsp:Transcript_25416/g.39111  ORF Transcript_25416/g.39111 Transcript_25416/m.39111 type:complete len:212 (-) Transcript_25416:15-650(-)